MLVPMHRVFQNPDRQAGKHTPHFLSSAARHHNAILRKGKKGKKRKKERRRRRRRRRRKVTRLERISLQIAIAP